MPTPLKKDKTNPYAQYAAYLKPGADLFHQIHRPLSLVGQGLPVSVPPPDDTTYWVRYESSTPIPKKNTTLSITPYMVSRVIEVQEDDSQPEEVATTKDLSAIDPKPLTDQK